MRSIFLVAGQQLVHLARVGIPGSFRQLRFRDQSYGRSIGAQTPLSQPEQQQLGVDGQPVGSFRPGGPQSVQQQDLSTPGPAYQVGEHQVAPVGPEPDHQPGGAGQTLRISVARRPLESDRGAGRDPTRRCSPLPRGAHPHGESRHDRPGFPHQSFHHVW